MNKVIWITGASSGIGKALAEAYCKMGFRIIITARREQELLELKNNCTHPENVVVLTHDLADYTSAKKKVERAVAAFGSIDVMIHNAGISQRSLAIDTDIEVDKKLMDVNYIGTIALTKALLPYFKKQGSGHFAVITSLVGKFGSPYRSGYAASKHALHGYFDSLRAEHEKDNLKVTLICPGYVITNVSINALTGDGSAQKTMDEATANGITAEYAAAKIVKAIDSKKLEIYIGKKEIFAVYLKRFLPNLFARILAKAKVT
jgi:short-subunit dehydrogenase